MESWSSALIKWMFSFYFERGLRKSSGFILCTVCHQSCLKLSGPCKLCMIGYHLSSAMTYIWQSSTEKHSARQKELISFRQTTSNIMTNFGHNLEISIQKFHWTIIWNFLNEKWNWIGKINGTRSVWYGDKMLVQGRIQDFWWKRTPNSRGWTSILYIS